MSVEAGGPEVEPARPARERILGAAMSAFAERGYAGTSTLEIATRARVSKRELYALFGSKHAVLVACIAGRASRMQLPPSLPAPRDRDELAAVLTTYASILMRESCHPKVLGVFRLAVTEADRSPEVARTLIASGREVTRAALSDLLARAQSAELLEAGEPAAMAEQFAALLWGDLLLELLLRIVEAPEPEEIDRRARSATAAFLQLHPAPAPHPR
jgi:AcrR family transcriptional regulator